MKQNQKPRSVDISNKEEARKVAPLPPLLTSHDAGWKNMYFEHHRQPTCEIPETIFQQHLLVVYLKEVLSEFKMDDRFERKNARRGDMLIIPADINYGKADRADSEFISLCIEPQKLLQSNRELIKGDNIELIPTFPTPDTFIYGTAIALKQELETDYNGCGLYAESLFNSLAFHLLYKYANKQPQLIDNSDGLAPYKLKQILNYIGDRLSEEVSVEAMANYLDLSPFHFCREFKKSVGLTPHKYIMQQRVEMAKILLKKERNLPLAEVALDCGFYNQSHFGRVFKSYVGTTPKRYRESL